VRPNLDGSQNLRSSPNIDVAGNFGNAATLVVARYRYLLKNLAVNADCGFRMNDNSVGMINPETASYSAVEGDLCASDYAPESMSQDTPFANAGRYYALFIAPMLVSPNSK
jgi:hypothetical protein